MQPFDSVHIYTVSELTRDIKSVLELDFGHVWVCGEISNCKLHSSGHMYCTLKDDRSQLNVVFFRSDAVRLPFRPEDGLQVNVEGRITVYERRGNYQLVATRAEPVGYGALQLAFEQLKKRLGEEGLFDEEHKKPIPRFPQRIGIVTSPTGAAIRDILHVLERRFSSVEVVLFPSLVQGEGAAEEISAGIDILDTHGKVDVIIAGRGGGSLEDLWAFNEEAVARAIYECETPVVSAVGHEIDFTISDFVADLRAPTPSAAAELVVRERESVVSEIAELRDALGRSVTALLTEFGHRLQLARTSYGFRQPADRLSQYEQQLDDMRERVLELQNRRLVDIHNRLSAASKRLRIARPDRAIDSWRERVKSAGGMLKERALNVLAVKQGELANAAARLDSLSPLAVLARGYSIAFRVPTGEIVRDSTVMKEGDRLHIRLHRGSLECAVEKVED